MEPLLVAERYSHGVRITKFSRDLFYKMQGFIEGLSLKEPKKIPGRGMVMELKKKYYGLTNNHRELTIHRHCYDDLVAFLGNQGVPVDRILLTDIPVPIAASAAYDMFEMYVLRDYQEIIHEDAIQPERYSVRIDLQTGKGKAEPLDALVKVPGGWKRMGDMQLGDTVTAADGSPTKVIGVYPQGSKRIYNITFADGRKVQACGEHLWKVYYVNTQTHRRWRIVDTHEMHRLISMPNPRVYVPLCEHEHAPDVELPMAPYTLGAMLGNGCTSAGISFTSANEHTLNRVRAELPPGLTLVYKDRYDYRITSGKAGKNPYTSVYRQFNLLGLLSHEKFIPEIYMNSSREQKLELLRGLMDTDGTVQKSGSLSYCTTSPKLATQVQELIWSLGGIAYVRPRVTRYTHNGEKKTGRVAYEVDIRFKKPSELVSLPRKLERINDDNQYSKDLKLRVMDISYACMKEAQCISVEHPDHLYVTDNHVVTHNTLTSLAILKTLNTKCIIMLPPKYFGLWQKALNETYKDIGLRYCRVSGSEEMKSLIDRGLANDLGEFDIFLISSVSYRNYIEDYETYGEETFYDATGYNVFPQQFHQLLGVGCQINDEIQEDPGLLFRIDMYTNVAKQIYLSATPFTGNAYVTKMIDVMLPEWTKVRLPNYDIYINVMGLFYNDPKVKPKDYLTPFKNTYNHARYETQMLKNPARLDAYLKMIFRVAEGVFLKDRLPGQKCLFLFATVAFIEYVTKQMKAHFKEHGIVIDYHVSGSDYANLMTNDLTNSTIKSSGTGVDIKNLREIVRCHATNSKKDNIQIAGRGRKLKDFPDISPRLTVLICQQIPHQMRYGADMREQFEGKTNTIVYRRMS